MKNHSTLLACLVLLFPAVRVIAATPPILINVQFGTAELVFDPTLSEDPTVAVTSTNDLVESFSGNEGILPGGFGWNLIRPSVPSPNRGYGIGNSPLSGTFPHLKDASGKATDVGISIASGAMVATSVAKNSNGVGYYAEGFQALMNSWLLSNDGTVVIEGLVSGAAYNLALYGHGTGYEGVSMNEITTFKVNGVEKKTGTFDMNVSLELNENIDYVTY